MAWFKRTWVAKVTQLSATEFNRMEDGIEQGIRAAPRPAVVAAGSFNMDPPTPTQPADFNIGPATNVGERVLVTSGPNAGIFIFNGYGTAMTRAPEDEVYAQVGTLVMVVPVGSNRTSGTPKPTLYTCVESNKIWRAIATALT